MDRYSSVSSQSDERPADLKKVGILSQTLTPSSQVRWILPARIRSQRHNDVVFIGESCIQLRECLPNGILLEATGKLNIGAQIMTAKVVSAKLVAKPCTEQVVNQSWEDHEFYIKDRPCGDDEPPQIVVLCTAASELIYLYARDAGFRGTRFVYAKKNIISNAAGGSKFGRHMAVDPQSKALAVASTKTICIQSVKEMDDLKAAIDSWKPRQPALFQPSREQRFIPVGGVLLRMEFLQGPADEQDMVYLLVIMAKAGQTRLVLYRWSSKEPLLYFEPMKCSGHLLLECDSFPLLVVPAFQPLSFWIVTETELVFFENIRTPPIKRLASRLPSDTILSDRPLWVQWAKPSRHEAYSNQKEDIMLVREDGMTRQYTRSHHSVSDSLICVAPGQLPMSLDTAMCMLPGTQDTPGDILIAGGVGCNGGVFHLPARSSYKLLQTIPNLSPVRTMSGLSGQTRSKFRKNLSPQAFPDRHFAITACQDGTALYEYRFGLEAQNYAEYDAPGCSDMDRMWAFVEEEDGLLYLIGSGYQTTTAFALQISKPDLVEILPPNESPGLILGPVTTRAMAKLASGPFIQITKDRMIVSESMSPAVTPQHEVNLSKCICADVSASDGVFVIACAASDDFCIEIGMISQAENKIRVVMAPTTWSTTKTPTSLRVATVKDFHLLAIGFSDGSIEILSFSASDSSLKRQARALHDGPQRPGKDAIDILYRPDDDSAIMMTGSRDGRLDVWRVNIGSHTTASDFEIVHLSSYSMGLTRVFIKHDEESEDVGMSAFVSSDSRLARISLVNDKADVDFVFDDIWITNRGTMSSTIPHMVRAVCRIPTLKTGEPVLNGSVVFGSQEAFMCTVLLEQRQMIPRHIASFDDARHFEYSPFLDKIIIITDGITVRNKAPVIHLIGPDDAIVVTASGFGRATERVKSLLNWRPSDGKTHYDLLIVGLYDGTDSVVGYLNAKKLPSQTGDDALNLKNLMSLPKSEVHAICEFGSSSLVARKWSSCGRYTLPSPAVSIAGRGSFVYAATKGHSMLVLRVVDNKFTIAFADKSAKNVRHVLPFGQDGKHVIISAMSGEGTSIIGYMQGASISEQPLPSFEAQIPLPIDHLYPVSTNWSHDEHHCFQSSTIDGTMYQFKTLDYQEWRLLRFLEHLAQPDIVRSSKRPISLLTSRMARAWVSEADSRGVRKHDPTKMHVRGDVLERLIELGSSGLRNLLGSTNPKIKTETKTKPASNSRIEVKIKEEEEDDDDAGKQGNEQESMDLDSFDIDIDIDISLESGLPAATAAATTKTEEDIEQGTILDYSALNTDGHNNTATTSQYAKFEALALPIVGPKADMVGAVVAWVRRLLRSSTY